MSEVKAHAKQLARWAMGELLPRRTFLVHGSRARNACYLTFDDGPHPEHTPRLLDYLAEHSLKATFFVLGSEAERYPEIVARMADEGHTVGNHTWSHAWPEGISAGEFLQEAIRTRSLVAGITGVVPTLLRPPHGKVTAGMLWRTWQAGFTVVLWNVDPKDYSCQSANEVAERLAGWRVRAGDVILLHDVHGHIGDTVARVVGCVKGQNPALAFQSLGSLASLDRAVHATAS